MISKKSMDLYFLRRKLDEEEQHGQQGKGRKRTPSGRNRGKKAGRTAACRGPSKEGREKYGEEKGQRDALKQENQFKGDNKDRVI